MLDTSVVSPSFVRPVENGSAHVVDVVAPDEYCADLLVSYAAPLVAAEIVEGSPFTVRLRPCAGPASALRVRLLVDCWLEAVPLPCAVVLHAGESYTIRREAGATEIRVGRDRSRPDGQVLARAIGVADRV